MSNHVQCMLFNFVHVTIFLCLFFCSHRTYTFNDRRYGHYQPNGYGYQYPGQKNPNQYPQGVPLGEDKFKYDPVCNLKNAFLITK